jgi:hypothetical protein
MRILDAEKDGEEKVGEGNVFMWVLKRLYLLAYIPRRNAM